MPKGIHRGIQGQAIAGTIVRACAWALGAGPLQVSLMRVVAFLYYTLTVPVDW